MSNALDPCDPCTAGNYPVTLASIVERAFRFLAGHHTDAATEGGDASDSAPDVMVISKESFLFRP